MSTFAKLRADREDQLVEYRQRRRENPAHFGNDLFGAMDGTHEQGPAWLICHSGSWMHDGGLVWCVHKHEWPLDYIYCFGKAWDSRGERTDPLLTIDVRTLPKEFVGRYKLKITSANAHHRKAHSAVLGRAFAAGFDFAAHARQQLDKANAEAVMRRQEREALEFVRSRVNAAIEAAPELQGECVSCHEQRSLLSNGFCLPCDNSIPF